MEGDFSYTYPNKVDNYNIIIKDGIVRVSKKNSIRLLGKYFDFPVKISQLLLGIPLPTAFGIAIDLLKAKLKKIEVNNYRDYFIKGFGKTGYSIVFEGFAKKVWGNPEQLSEELARRRSPASSVFDVLKSALVKNDKNVSAEYFFYPKKGFGEIGKSLEKNIIKKKGKIMLDSKVEKININEGKINDVEVIKNGKKMKIKTDLIVSSIPIDELPELISKNMPSEIVEESKKLKFRALIVAYIFLSKEKALNDNWIFFPEKEFCFNRIAELKSFSHEVCPKGKTVLTAEITCDANDSIFKESDEEIKKIVIADLIKAGLIKEGEVFDFITRRAKKVYPVYDINYRVHLSKVLNELDKIKGLFTVGRPGLFNYNNSDHSIDMAKKTADIIIKNKGIEEWKKAKEYFDSYRIVD